MINKTRILKLSILVALISISSYILLPILVFHHHTDFKNFRRYLWVFKEPFVKDIDTFSFVGNVRKRDIFYYYVYCKDVYVLIWEFKDLKNLDLNDLIIKQGFVKDNIKTGSWETVNEDSFTVPQISNKLGFSLNDFLEVIVDDRSKIFRTFDSLRFKGIYGYINKISFADEHGDQIILFKYRNSNEPTVLLFFKKEESTFALIINSKNTKFDENIIKIFNL